MFKALLFLRARCLPRCITVDAYPDALDRDPNLVERTLAAFVRAVIPGVEGSPDRLTRIYADDYYPFAAYRGYFASDVCRRAEKRYGRSRFDALNGPPCLIGGARKGGRPSPAWVPGSDAV